MKKHLNLIQLSRALVPLFVIIFHVKAFMIHYFDYNFLNLPSVTKSGGVYYFFALSGFMVYYLYHKQLGNKKIIKDFLFSRFIRIYPIYWILTLCIIPFYFLIPNLGSGEETAIGEIVTSFLLLPYETEPILGVAWSLVHTVFFYIIFLCVFFNNKWIQIIPILLWGLFSSLFSLKLLTAHNYLVDFVFNVNNLIFLAGIGCAYLVLKYQVNYYVSWICVSLGLFGFPFSWLNAQYDFVQLDLQVITTIASILLLIGLSSIDLQKDIVIPRFIKFLGDASFSIYLTHYSCISALCLIIGQNRTEWVPNLLLLALLFIVISIVSGCFVYLLVEKPIHRKLKALQRGRRDLIPMNKSLDYHQEISESQLLK